MLVAFSMINVSTTFDPWPGLTGQTRPRHSDMDRHGQTSWYIWNLLPNEIKKTAGILSFKRLIMIVIV